MTRLDDRNRGGGRRREADEHVFRVPLHQAVGHETEEVLETIDGFRATRNSDPDTESIDDIVAADGDSIIIIDDDLRHVVRRRHPRKAFGPSGMLETNVKIRLCWICVKNTGWISLKDLK
jgi:hypothetical protein